MMTLRALTLVALTACGANAQAASYTMRATIQGMRMPGPVAEPVIYDGYWRFWGQPFADDAPSLDVARQLAASLSHDGIAYLVPSYRNNVQAALDDAGLSSIRCQSTSENVLFGVYFVYKRRYYAHQYELRCIKDGS